MKTPQLLKLSRVHFILALTTLAAIAVVLMIVMSPAIGGWTCAQFDMPEYERTFGFKLGILEVPSASGGTYKVHGLESVETSGIFASAGLRSGDIPRVHHGLSDFCGELHAAVRGDSAELRVINVSELRQGADKWRDVTVRMKVR